MIDQTVRDIEFQIQTSKNLTSSQKQILQELVESLKKEVLQLSRTHREAADSIANFVRLTAGEGLKEPRNPKLFQIAVTGINASVEKFEVSHPALTLTVNNFCTYFSNLGI